jgi:glutathione synthase
MSGFNYNNYPPEATSAETEKLVQRAAHHSRDVEFLVASPTPPPASIPAPITLYPSLFPRSCFETAVQLQPSYNLLYANIANDVGFLEEAISRWDRADALTTS